MQLWKRQRVLTLTKLGIFFIAAIDLEMILWG